MDYRFIFTGINIILPYFATTLFLVVTSSRRDDLVHKKKFLGKTAKIRFLILLSLSFVMRGIGSIILINGHGSVGKSSISKCLEKLFSDDAVFIGLDNEILWPHAKKEAERLGLMHEGMSLQEQQKILMECRYKIIAENNWIDFVREFHTLARSLVEKYRYVVLDTVLGFKDTDIDNGQDLQDFTEKMQGIDVFHVFVYAAPSVHLQHLIARNQLPGYYNKRPVISSLQDFLIMYRPIDHDSDINLDCVVDLLAEKEVENMLSLLQLYLQSIDMSSDDIKKIIIQIRELYQQLFFSKYKNAVSIAAYMKPDLLINSGKMSSQQSAQLIYETFCKQ